MNGHGIRYISYESEREGLAKNIYAQKNRQIFISPPKDQKGIPGKDGKPPTSPAKYIKNEKYLQKQIAEARVMAFQRSRGTSNDKNEKSRTEYRSASKGVEENRREVLKFSQIRKRLQDEIRQRQKLQELTVCQELKLSNLGQQCNKLRQQKKQLDRVIFELQKDNQDGKNSLQKANQTIDNLNKNIKEMRINLKSLNTLKNLQNQIEFLQDRNKNLDIQNQSLIKSNNNLKKDIDRMMRQSTSESQCGSKLTKMQTASSRSLDKRLPGGPFGSVKTEKEKFLEANLHDLEKKLYQKEKEVKKMQIQLNCIDRKKIMSIDEVKVKKDKEIKDLRQKFMKVTKDFKETKDKLQKNEKKQRNSKQTVFLRKVRSSKQLGMNSESEVTLELSSQP